MRHPSRFALLVLLAASASVPAAPPGPVSAIAGPQPSTVRIEFAIDGDGRVMDAKVGTQRAEGGADVIAQALLKKAHNWRFEPFTWQGKSATTTFNRFIEVELVPTTSGGFAMRVKGINRNAFAFLGQDSIPQEAGITYRWKNGQYLMLFRVKTDVEGRPVKVARAVPDNRFPKGVDALVEAKEKMLKEWRQPPAMVDGNAVACSRLYVMQILPDKRGLRIKQDQQGWYSDVDLAKLLPAEAEIARAAMAATADACPPPRLVTTIEGLLL